MKPQSLFKQTKKYASPSSNYGRETPGYKEKAKRDSIIRAKRIADDKKAFFKMILG